MFYSSVYSDAYFLKNRIIDPEFDVDEAWLADVAHEIETKGAIASPPVFSEIDYHNGHAAMQHGLSMEKARREEKRLDEQIRRERREAGPPLITWPEAVKAADAAHPAYRPPPPPPEKKPLQPKPERQPLIERFHVYGDLAGIHAYPIIRGFIEQAQFSAPESLWRRDWDLWSCQCWAGAVKLDARAHACGACGSPLVKIARYAAEMTWWD